MVALTSQIDAIHANLNRLKGRIPDLPVEQILTTRTLVMLGRELSSMLDQRLRPYGLSDIEFRALMSIYSLKDTPAYPGDLCGSLGNSPANITRITDNLVDRGLLSRIADERDRRRLQLTITPAGEQLIQDMFPVMLVSMQDSFQGFNATDVEQLLQSLKHLANVIDAANARSDLEQEAAS